MHGWTSIFTAYALSAIGVKALAEAAVLLVLKKTIDNYYKEEDDEPDEPSEKSS